MKINFSIKKLGVIIIKLEFKEIPEYLIKIFIALSSITYIIGFFIVNIYLAKFGVASIELIKGRYILVGLVFLIFLFSTFYTSKFISTYLIVIWNSKRKKEKVFLGKIIKSVHSIFVVLIFSAVGLIPFVTLIYISEINRIEINHLIIIIESFIILIFFNIIAIIAKKVFFGEIKEKNKNEIYSEPDEDTNFVNVNDKIFYDFRSMLQLYNKIIKSYFILILILVQSFIIYFMIIFPVIPSEIGGGISKPISIYINDNSLKAQIENKEKYKRVFLLDQNEKDYILLFKYSETYKVVRLPIEKAYIINENKITNEFNMNFTK